MGIISKDLKEGDKILYKLKEKDKKIKNKKTGDVIKGEILKKKGNKVDIKWENGEIDKDIDEKELMESVDNIKEYLKKRKDGVYEFFGYKIRKRKNILEGYKRDKSVLFRIFYEDNNKYKNIFDNFKKYLINKRLIIEDEIIEKHKLDNINLVFVENEEEFLKKYYEQGVDEFKDTYKFNDIEIEYFVGIDEFGNQSVFYIIKNKKDVD